MDVLTPVAQRASKNFMDQYTPEERYQIELSDKAGKTERKLICFPPSYLLFM
jgi:outer membrane biogenesis lipoprotein LolB